MRKLIGCPSCKRQYDAAGLVVGSRFRCRCGTAITIPEIRSHDAAVVRCGSCGAPRADGAAACAHCGSDFTLHEQDLETICPSCLARISDRARFCHHCGTPIAPEDVAARETTRTCPACGEGHSLHSRALGATGFSALECGRCAGLWLGDEVFRAVAESARAAADLSPDLAALRAEAIKRPRTTQPAGPFYRPCPQCGTRMTRVNFSHLSAILLDRCSDHGVWFDAAELDAALRWIRGGGERLATQRAADEERARASQLKFKVEPKAPEDARGPLSQPAAGETDFFPWIVSLLFRG